MAPLVPHLSRFLRPAEIDQAGFFYGTDEVKAMQSPLRTRQLPGRQEALRLALGKQSTPLMRHIAGLDKTFTPLPAGQVLDTLRSNEKNRIKGLSAPIKTDTTNETEKENDHGLYCN